MRQPAAYELIAYDAMTGEELWTGELPSMAETIPAIYEVDGRQYVAVSASEGERETDRSAYVAFALPQ